ncbi:ATP-binding cassette domain-containing protein [Succinimonas amylolytica]|uniref:ATP-binding cassette domain-containing protein n=1 Tax=Succinimonas amylolytica TaxID=83769 RepID=UPI0023A7C892
MAENRISIGEGTRLSEDFPYFRNGFRILEGSLSVFCSCLGNSVFRIGTMGAGDALKRYEFDEMLRISAVAETDLELQPCSAELPDSEFEASLTGTLYREYPESPRIITLANFPEMVYALTGERESFDRSLSRQNRILTASEIGMLLGEAPWHGAATESSARGDGSGEVSNKNALLGIVREICEEHGLEVHDGWGVFDIPGMSLDERLKAFAEINGFRMRRLRLSGSVIRTDTRYLVFRKTEDARKRIPMVLSSAGRFNCLDTGIKGERREFFAKSRIPPLDDEAYEFMFPENDAGTAPGLFSGRKNGYRVILLLFLISAFLVYGLTPFFIDYFVSDILPFGEYDEIFRSFIFLSFLILAWAGFEMIPRMLLDIVSVRNVEKQGLRVMDSFFAGGAGAAGKTGRGVFMRSLIYPVAGAEKSFDSSFAMFYSSSVIVATLFPIFAIGGSCVGGGCLVLAGIMAAMVYLVVIRAIEVARETQKQREVYRRVIRETAQGIVHIRACNAEDNFTRIFLKSFVPGMRSERDLRRKTAIYHYAVSIFPVLSLPVLLLLMSFFGKTDLSQNLAVMAAGFFFIMAVVNLVAHVTRWHCREQDSRNDMADFGRPDTGKIVKTLDGHIEVKNISFRYPGQEEYVFKNVSLDILPGQFVAVVGPSGSGKTTLIRLLLGELGLESGQIFWGGLGQGAINLHFLRRQVGTAFLDSTVFAGTIFDNIAIGTAATEAEVWKVLDLVSFAAEVRSWPMGIHTAISRDRISGGQMQKILIARALIGKPRALILDEATSALDTISQDRILSNISRMNITRIITTHRMSTVINADRIYILDNGGIRDAGTYRELMHRSGFFRMLALGKNRENME